LVCVFAGITACSSALMTGVDESGWFDARLSCCPR
jgi:hypothetical protein